MAIDGGLTELDPSLVVSVFTALGIGALIGLERERAVSGGRFAGSRTLPLIAMLGALVQLFYPQLLLVAAALVGVLVVLAYVYKVEVEGDLGLTSAIATVLVFVYGAMTTHSPEGYTLAVILGVLTTGILAVKGPLHSFANRLDWEDLRATITFLIVALVVLPLLPDRGLDVLLGLNPRFVWLMVVFVSGISLLAYVLSQLLGPERGIGILGVLGGFVSSTATTVSMAERARSQPGLWAICGFAVVAASSTMFPRALAEVAVVYTPLVRDLAVPMAAMTLVGGTIALGILWWHYGDAEPDLELTNPFRLKPALLFGALFAVILLVSKHVSLQYGTGGIYATAFVSGLADVDAIAISLARLAGEGSISESVATTGIVIAAVANTLVKAGIAWTFGTRKLGKLVVAGLALTGATGLGLVLLV
ncbi:MAG: MgtC/SapB family protein [Haloarculaceae archaeon]